MRAEYDMDAMLIEVELLLDWYMPRLGVEVTAEMRKSYVTLWRKLLQPAIDMKPTWVLRDFHSPNLIWLPDRKDLGRIGLLDFQDAVMGPPAYDVASILQDARVDVPEEMEVALLGHYVKSRREIDEEFDPKSFVTLYSTMAAQRASKILGIFARLDRRDRHKYCPLQVWASHRIPQQPPLFRSGASAQPGNELPSW